MGALRLVESFLSIQGEGKFQGRAAIFLRFAGCNLNCAGFGVQTRSKKTGKTLIGCDTARAVFTGHFSYEILSSEQILARVERLCDGLNFKPVVVFTGGEPLLYAANENFVNLEKYFDIDTIYQGLGIDRIAACYGIRDGVVVDAGSAITVDIMANSMHLGGYIMPGISAMLAAYESISPRLKVPINSQIDIDALPQKTADAVSYGIFKPVVTLIEKLVGNKNVYFTGGDGEFLSKFFKNAVCDKMLVFRAMQKLIREKGIK